MLIRLTTEADLPYLDAIFDACRDYMAAQGNPTQWDANYPNSKVVAQDVIDGTGYVCVDENSGEILGTFALGTFEGEYDRLQGGKWNYNEPYVVIHRLGTVSGRGVGSFILCELQKQYPYIRVDTHEDNQTMLHLFDRFGFKYCGTVSYPGYGERVAYDYHS